MSQTNRGFSPYKDVELTVGQDGKDHEDDENEFKRRTRRSCSSIWSTSP